MATKNAETKPGASLDEQPKKVYTDAALNEVGEGSEAAAFSWLPGDLERAKERREELGFDDRARAQAASAKAELALANRLLKVAQDRVASLESTVAGLEAAGKPEAEPEAEPEEDEPEEDEAEEDEPAKSAAPAKSAQPAKGAGK